MIQTEPTPNPESLKFLSENIISAIGTEEFQKNEINKVTNSFIKEASSKIEISLPVPTLITSESL